MTNLASPPAAGAPGVVRRQVAAVVARVREQMDGTPGRLRRAAVLAVLVALVFGVTGGQAFRLRADAISAARDDAAQLVRLQTIHTDLVRADASATNAFLVGGLEPAEQRAEYVEALDSAARLVSEAARAQPADADALGVLNAHLLEYSGLVESARANNRQWAPSTCATRGRCCGARRCPSWPPSSTPTSSGSPTPSGSPACPGPGSSSAACSHWPC